MTTAQPRHLMERDLVTVSDYGGDDAIVLQQIREANQDRAGKPGGALWFFQRSPDDDSCALHAGVRDDLGVLQWFDNDGDQVYLPGGQNTDYVDYFSWFGHHYPMDPYTEVPIDLVLRAVAEFVRTCERPTCVDWTAEERASR